MLRTVSIFLLAACFVTVAKAATDGDNWESVKDCQVRLKSPIKCFSTHARAGFALCSIKWKLALMTGNSDDAAACIGSAKDAMPPHFEAAKSRFKKNQAGLALLKSAYASWVAGMNALIPSGTGMDYERRTEAKQIELDEMLTRLEIEE